MDRDSALGETLACQLTITTSYVNTEATIRLIGELDIAVVADVLEVVKVVVAVDGLTAVRLDASSVTFIDSTGLRILLQARQIAADSSLTFTLTTTHSSPVATLVDVCGLGGRLADCRS